MKTKTITLTIPADMSLGQAIMNAYRELWSSNKGHNEMLDRTQHLIDSGMDKFKAMAIADSESRNKYWDIWEQDTEQIQNKINQLK